ASAKNSLSSLWNRWEKKRPEGSRPFCNTLELILVMASSPRSLNSLVLLIFAPILILTGILGFVIPADKGLMSGAPAYNIFHIVAGSIGLLLVLMKDEDFIRAFNI